MRDGKLAALCLALLLAVGGCAGPAGDGPVPKGAAPPGAEPGEPIADVLDRWESQRADASPMGLAATFDLRGNLTVRGPDGSLTGDLASPFTLRPAPAFPDDRRVVYLHNATVDGVGEGLLILEGRAIRAKSGRLGAVNVDRIGAGHPETVRIRPAVTDDHPAHAHNLSGAVASDLVHVEFTGLTVDSVGVTGYENATLVRDNRSTSLSGPITVSAAGIWWDRQSRIHSQSVRLETGDFSISAPGGATGTVSVSATAQDDVNDPRTVFGHAATLAVEAGRVRTVGEFRLTQTLTDDGPVLPATVDVLPTRTNVTVPSGGTKWVKVHYRERSYVGDGILANVTVGGDGSDLVAVPLERPDPLVLEIVRELADTPGGQVALVFGSPALAALAGGEVLFTAFDCLVRGCPDQHPYPTWIEAGEIGRFYYRVNATGVEPGRYDSTIHVDGSNYESFEIPVTVTVVEPTQTPTSAPEARASMPGAFDG